MKGLFKKFIAGVSTVAVVSCACIPAMAQTEMDNMVFAGYDTTVPEAPNKIYNEVIGGHYTNKQILVPVTPEWRVEGFESEYPYAGYSRMYLEGNRQNITAYNQLSPQWETRRKDYFWEVKSPYKIWERQQTKVNNKTWKWDFGNAAFGIPDSSLLNRTNRYAVVTKTEMKDYGFGKYNKNGDELTQAEKNMYSSFFQTIDYQTFYMSDVITTWDNLTNLKFQDNKDGYGLLTPKRLSEKYSDTNRFVISDEEIAAAIPVVQSNYITAKFSNKNNEGLATKSVAAEFLQHGTNWDWDYGTSFRITHTAKISWTAPAYELVEPYNYYQILVVNGVPMDGKNGRDYIYRYTGGKASPNVVWKFAFFQNAKDANGDILENVYEVVERKYVDGVPGVDAKGNPVYRVPTGEYGNTYFKQNGTTIEYWVVDKKGNKTLLGKAENFTGKLGTALDTLTNQLVTNQADNKVDSYAPAVMNYVKDLAK